MGSHIYDSIIIGGGPAGYTAALYAARAGLDVLVLEKTAAGGQMALTSQIENYPGFPQGLDGFTLGQDMKAGAEQFGAKSQFSEVVELDLHAQPKVVRTASDTLLAKTVIYAAGASPTPLGLPEESALIRAGISYSAHCDGMFYRNKTVVVVGGGDTAAAAALQLSRICKKVMLVHRRDTLRATRVYHRQLENTENVEFHWNSVVSALLQDQVLTGVQLTDVQTGEKTELSCDGVFVCIGYTPATGLVADQLELDSSGYILADETTCTNIAGVFAAGDVRAKHLRQIITATADGAMAAQQAEEYIFHN